MGKFGSNIKRMIVFLVGLTIITHLVIIFNVRTKVVKQKKLVRDHEEALCNFRLERSESAVYQNRQECPQNGIVTIFYAGGLYSHIWGYSSVWAVARVTHLTPFIPLCMYNFLSKAFDDMRIPPLTSIAECDIPLPRAAQSYESWLDSNQSIVLPIFSAMSELVLPRMSDLTREFRMKRNLLKEGERILRDFTRNKFENPVYVGVHIPSNWVNFSDGLRYPDKEFFLAVFQHVRNRKSNPVFVIVTDDKSDQFSGNDILVVNTTGRFGIDLAVLSLCNMSVLGYNDIGVWGAIFSRGETIVFDETEGKFEDYLRLLPNWKIFG